MVYVIPTIREENEQHHEMISDNSASLVMCLGMIPMAAAAANNRVTLSYAIRDFNADAPRPF